MTDNAKSLKVCTHEMNRQRQMKVVCLLRVADIRVHTKMID